MTRVISSLADLAGQYDALFCDLWGCLHNGCTAYPAAVAALLLFRAQGGRVLLLTNSPRPKSSVVAQLDGLRVPRDCYDEVASSGDAAQHALLTGAVGRRVFHIGPPKDLVFFTDLSDDLQRLAATEPPITRVALDEAEGVVCTGLFDDRTEIPNDYAELLARARARGLPLLCANPDLVVDLGDKRIYCAGAIAAAYEAIGGMSLYFGKPHAPIYDLARRRLAALPGMPANPRILAVGDGIGTDVAGAIAQGLDALFVTAGLSAAEFGADPARPDAARLSAWLEHRQLNPAYAMGFLS